MMAPKIKMAFSASGQSAEHTFNALMALPDYQNILFTSSLAILLTSCRFTLKHFYNTF